ncbi:PREDICTED: uncharacterized protein LOC106745481 [Dinoponera quadriceps]|uniref:Uncharacterized protein LOC106745481 n=1 Tax=Dinoponera quadriceps TaxID=609295 RepID=A0A6P3XFE3_DINQU|nr:PREDICTED: uncharacterized protein LOC106745481 [Dinoponera quadriceps]
MFSRATKLIVRSFGPRQFHIGRQNLKNAFTGDAGEISWTLSQLLRNSTKLNVLALYDLTAVIKPLPNQHRIRNYCDQPFIPTHLKDANRKKSSSIEDSSSVITINNAKKVGDSSILNFFNRQADNGKGEIKEIMEALYRLPIAEGVPTLNNSSMPNEITKAGNARSGLRPHARLLDEIGPNGTRTQQRDCATIRKWLPDLTCSPFQGYVNFIATTETSRRHLPIEDNGKIGNSVRDAKENNCRSLPSTSLSDDGKPTRLIGKFNNTGIVSDAKTLRRTETLTSRLMSGTLLNNKPKCLRDICGQSGGFCGWLPTRTFVSATNDWIPINREGNRFWGRSRIEDLQDNAIIPDVVKGETGTQRTWFGEESVLSNSHAQIRSRSTTILDSHHRGNIPVVNEALAVPVYDAPPARTVLFTSKEFCDSKSNIRRKLEKICAALSRLRKRKDKDDICEKRQKSCSTAEETCQERREACEGRSTDCSARCEQACGKQTTVLCSGGKSSSCGVKDDRDVCETRKEKCSQKRSWCKGNNNCGAKVDPCKKKAPCNDSKKDTCGKTKEERCGKRENRHTMCKDKKKKVCFDIKKARPQPKEEECPPLRLKTESSDGRFRERGTIGERREGSSPPARSAVELSVNGRSIERGESEANRGPLYTIASSRRRYDSRQPEEPGLSCGDRSSNDNYFPQGEDFEDEIVRDDHRNTSERTREKEPRQFDDESDNFAPTLLMLRNDEGRVGGDALTRFITHTYSSSVTEAGHAMSKGAFEKDAVEKLQILIEKAIGGTGLRLGESDCGEGPPVRPTKNPCDPPKGPCRPSDPPGYPASKPQRKPKRKPFCVKCPPKKPCKNNSC